MSKRPVSSPTGAICLQRPFSPEATAGVPQVPDDRDASLEIHISDVRYGSTVLPGAIGLGEYLDHESHSHATTLAKVENNLLWNRKWAVV